MMLFHAGTLHNRQSVKHRRRSATQWEMLEGRQLLSTLKQDVGKLAHDLNAIHLASNVTSAQVQAVTSDLKAIAAVATKPDQSTVAALKNEIRVAFADGVISPREAAALKKDVVAVLASANIPTSLVQQTTVDFQSIITSSGVTKQDVKLIAGDLNAILTDLGAIKK